jgi:hypothetical protein
MKNGCFSETFSTDWHIIQAGYVLYEAGTEFVYIVEVRILYEHGPVHVRFVVDKMVLGQFSLEYFCLVLLESFC